MKLTDLAESLRIFQRVGATQVSGSMTFQGRLYVKVPLYEDVSPLADTEHDRLMEIGWETIHPVLEHDLWSIQL